MAWKYKKGEARPKLEKKDLRERHGGEARRRGWEAWLQKEPREGKVMVKKNAFLGHLRKLWWALPSFRSMLGLGSRFCSGLVCSMGKGRIQLSFLYQCLILYPKIVEGPGGPKAYLCSTPRPPGPRFLRILMYSCAVPSFGEQGDAVSKMFIQNADKRLARATMELIGALVSGTALVSGHMCTHLSPVILGIFGYL